jgi:hypothetical protein
MNTYENIAIETSKCPCAVGQWAKIHGCLIIPAVAVDCEIPSHGMYQRCTNTNMSMCRSRYLCFLICYTVHMTVYVMYDYKSTCRCCHDPLQFCEKLKAPNSGPHFGPKITRQRSDASGDAQAPWVFRLSESPGAGSKSHVLIHVWTIQNWGSRSLVSTHFMYLHKVTKIPTARFAPEDHKDRPGSS